ncbi:MAG TPA: hypothetical protein VMC85_20885 [Desulfomonilaceae bacterium]|nr:hypothetical protein [Desulfomonilaceae bacterium]
MASDEKHAAMYRSIGRDAAIALFESGWWKTKTPKEIVDFQLFVDELCMEFSDFHGAVEKVLNRPIWTHEFAFRDSLVDELLGDKPAPTFQQILDLIPEEKRIIVVVQS